MARSGTKKKVLIFSAEQGHRSIAEAISASLTPTYQTTIVFDEIYLTDPYLVLYRFFPAAMKYPYEWSQSKIAQNIARHQFKKHFAPKVLDILQKNQPDVVITTYFPFLSAIDAQFASHPHHPFFCDIVTDPRSFHPLLLSKTADVTFVFDQQTKQLAQKFGEVKPIESAGWFVRPEFVPLSLQEKKRQRQRLGLEPETLTFLFASGSEGSNFILSALPGIFLTNEPLQVVIACGNNASLKKSLEQFAEFVRKKFPLVSIIPLGFDPDIFRYFQIADLILGKAGPNTLFESVAVHVPFFALSHMSGQETGNLDIIRDSHLGYVEERPLHAVRLLRRILLHPQLLQEFQPSIQKMAAHNRQAGPRLKKILEEHFAQSKQEVVE